MIETYNEWDSLKRVVVGDATWANWPLYDPVFSKESEKTTWQETPVPSGAVPQHIIDEANVDLDILVTTLTVLGVEVERPEPLNFQIHDGLYNYCPRDRFLVYGDTVVDTAMMYPCRDMEAQCYHHLFKDANVIKMPRNQGLVLDAANVLRLGDKWLFLESASGNLEAYHWLCSQFPNIHIEKCNFYSGVHIDSTIVPLREGLVILNGSRVTPNTCPKIFDGWEKIYVNEIVAQDFYQYPYASKWIGLNMLVVDPQSVIVDFAQKELVELLLKKGFSVYPRTLRHSRTLGGGFHCVTLDLHRSNK